MRVVYWYTSLGGAGNDPNTWGPLPTKDANNSLLNGFETEGFWCIWNELVKRQAVDAVTVIVESARGPAKRRWANGYEAYAIPHIQMVKKYGLLQDGDVLFVRGGFRTWFQELEEVMQRKKNWVLFYRAATHRLKWGFWDVVLEDLTDKHYEHPLHHRLHYRFNKPIHPDIFKYRGDRRDIDVMLHASHIHDKKGQWKGIDAAIAYQKLYGKNLFVAMPGAMYGGEKTREIMVKVLRHELKVLRPGMVERPALCAMMNRTKLYLHLGGAGQNDRGNLESMQCGCPQIIGSPEFHPPFVHENGFSRIVRGYSVEEVANTIHEMLELWTPEVPAKVAAYYESQNRLEVGLMQVWKLLDYIREHPVPNRESIMKEFL